MDMENNKELMHLLICMFFMTEIRSGSVTLSCQLSSYEVCDTLVRSEELQLIWVNQAGVNLMTDSRYQILFSSTHCNSTLTTTLLNEDHNREWRCQVTQRNQLKASATYTVKYSAPVDSTTLTPVSSSNSEKKSSRTTAADSTQQAPPSATFLPLVVVGVVAALAVLLAVIFWLIRKKNTKAGTSGAEVTHVFSGSGENVSFPCNNALSDCKSTFWIYSRLSETVELIAGGKKKNDIERRERLSLGSDCSLNIKKVTQEDYGLYSCRQFVNGRGEQQGTDAPVYLHVLHVSSSSSQTEIRSGSVTLSCQLYSYEVCDTLLRSEGLQLIWVNQAGVNLLTDSRYQILFSSTHCISTLTTTLLNEDHNREWRCQVTQRNQLKASATYTVKYSAPVDSTTLTPVSSSNSEKKSSRTTAADLTQQDPADTTSDHKVCMAAGSIFREIVTTVKIAVFAAPTVILLQIICARRAGRKDSHQPEEIEMPTVLE
ncbi:unnamed protein product [Leuciscus chuanchicus]